MLPIPDLPDPPQTQVGILIVAYNAVSTLAKVLGRIPETVWADVEEILVIDDGSQDATYELGVGYKVTSGNSKLTILKNPHRLGYGAIQKAGYQHFIDKGVDVVVLLHGDGQYPPEQLQDLYRPIVEGQADAVFGSRMLRKKAGQNQARLSLYKYAAIRLVSAFEQALLGLRLSEFHSGYRAYSLHALRQIDFSRMTDEYHFDTEIIIKLHHQGFLIHEVPIPPYRANELRYLSGIQYTLKVIRAVVRYRLTTASISRYPEFSEYFVHYPLKETRFSSHYYFELFVGRDSDVLDLGCGEGFFAARLHDKGNRIVGVDVLPSPQQRAAFADYFVGNLMYGLGDMVDALDQRRFDAILLQDVLEHLLQPEKVLRDSHQFLKSDGRIMVSVPNVANITTRLGLLLGRFTYTERGILDKTHLRFFTFRTMRRLLEDCDYEIIHEKATVMPFEIVFGASAHNPLARFINAILALLTGVMPTLLGYQCVFVARSQHAAK